MDQIHFVPSQGCTIALYQLRMKTSSFDRRYLRLPDDYLSNFYQSNWKEANHSLHKTALELENQLVESKVRRKENIGDEKLSYARLQITKRNFLDLIIFLLGAGATVVRTSNGNKETKITAIGNNDFRGPMEAVKQGVQDLYVLENDGMVH